jgi:hypothetical protein
MYSISVSNAIRSVFWGAYFIQVLRIFDQHYMYTCTYYVLRIAMTAIFTSSPL